MNTEHQFSYWEKDTFLKGYDLIVVGAGIVGLSSALFYKRRHPAARVLVLDKGWMPEGASTRNAGFACVGSITEYIADSEKESEEGVNKRIRNRYEGLILLKETLGEEHIGYEACGGYELFTDQKTFEAAAVYIPEFNDRMRRLIGEESVYSTSTLNGYNVIHNRLEGALHPGKMMQRYISLVNAEGVEVKWNTSVSDIETDGRVVLQKGIQLGAKKVLIAANGFVKTILPELSVNPARGYVFVTSELNSMSWKGTFHYDRGYIYFRNIGNRLLLGGARNIDSERETTDRFGINEKIKTYLSDFVNEKLKIEVDWQIDYEWSGIMGFTDSKTPVLKKLDNHRYVAAGLSGMGVAIGTKIGKEAAALLNDS